MHTCMYNACIQSDLAYPHTSILNEIVAKVRELDKGGSSSIVYSRIIADLFQQKLLQKVRELDIWGADQWGLPVLECDCAVIIDFVVWGYFKLNLMIFASFSPIAGACVIDVARLHSVLLNPLPSQGCICASDQPDWWQGANVILKLLGIFKVCCLEVFGMCYLHLLSIVQQMYLSIPRFVQCNILS